MIDLRDSTLPAAAVRAAMALSPHPEGGHYREIWRDAPPDGSRGAASTIHFLLAAGERSAPHRVDAAEIWVWNAGSPLRLTIGSETLTLGPNLQAGERLQAIVPAHIWQDAEPLGGWALVTCLVAPAFTFEGFELA